MSDPLFSTEHGNSFGNKSSDASSSQDSVLSSIGPEQYSQQEASLTQVYYGPSQQPIMTSQQPIMTSQQPIMTSQHYDDFSTTQGMGSHNLFGEEHEMNVITPSACESCDDGATTTHEPPSKEIGQASTENSREFLKEALKGRILANTEKETLQQNGAMFTRALASAETKKQDNEELRKGASEDEKKESADDTISPSMPSMLFVPAQEKTLTMETCVVENLARTTHVPETLALTDQNLEVDAVEPESREKAEAKQSKQEQRMMKRAESTAQKMLFTRRVRGSFLKITELLNERQEEILVEAKSVAAEKKEAKSLAAEKKEAKRLAANKKEVKRLAAEKPKQDKSKTQDGKSNVLTIAETSTEKTKETEEIELDEAKRDEILLGDTLGSCDMQAISHDERYILFEKLQTANESCENILRALRRERKSLSAMKIPSKVERKAIQVQINEYQEKQARFAEVLDEFSKKLREGENNDEKGEESSDKMKDGLVTKKRNEMDCSDPLFLLDNVNDKQAPVSEVEKNKKCRVVQEEKNAEGGHEFKKRKVESGETPQAGDNMGAMMILYAQIQDLTRQNSSLKSEVLIYKESALLNLQEKEFKASEMTLLKKKSLEIGSDLKSAKDENSKMISKIEKLDQETKRFQNLFSDEKNSHYNTKNRMDDDILKLEELLEKQAKLLEVKKKALRKAENSTNASNDSSDAPKNDDGKEPEKKMTKKQRSHGGTFGGLRSEQKRKATRQAAVAANGN
jgi:hypothetical protein